MRSVARLSFAPPVPVEPSPWAVRSAEHRAALCQVDAALRALLAAIPRDADGALLVGAVPALCLMRLGQRLDALGTAAAGGGTPAPCDPDEARRLHTVADVAKRLMTQLRALTLAANAERDLWADRLAATLGEAMALGHLP